MSYSVIAHLINDEPIEGEIDELPPPNATFITIKNPRKRRNVDLEWIDPHTNTLLLSFAHVMSVEVAALRADQELITKYGSDVR